MANVIPGISTRIAPGVVARQRVRQNVAVAPGGSRTALIIGEGLAEETLVVSALGGGRDGVNSDFSGTDSPDGRHFALGALDLIPGRTVILKNGVELTSIETTLDSDPFDSRYGVRIDIVNGRIQLQSANLVDYGNPDGTTMYYRKSAGNVGTGTLSVTAASLLSTTAPPETWTVRCTQIKTDALGVPISGEATFSVTGSVTGVVRNTAGNPITWKSDGVVVSNEILSFAITEGGTAFRVGDRFTIQVDSGVLVAGDSLEARYIPRENLDDPTVFSDTASLFAKHGTPSATNTLSLGASMAFENGASQVVCLQAAPSVPRTTSEVMLAADNPLSTATEGATGGVEPEDTIFAFDLGSRPDVDSNLSIFIVNSDGTEEQISANRVDFYDAAYTTIANTYSGFVLGSETNAYTVVSLYETEQEGDDGYLYTDIDGYTYFSSATMELVVDRNDVGESDVGKFVYVYDGVGTTYGRYEILEVGDGYGDNTFARVEFASGGGGSAQLDGADRNWLVVDEADTSAYLALTDDLVSVKLTEGKGLRVQFVDEDDADFYDTNWTSALEAAEAADAQIIVPLPTQTISNIFAAAKQHVIAQSSIVNANERMLVIGAINGLLPDNVTGTEDAAVEDIGVLEGIQGDSAEEVLAGAIEDLANYSVADAFGDTELVVYMYPDQIVRNIAGTNTVLSGYFSAAAMAGAMSAKSNVAEPMTNKTLAGFTIPRTRSYRPTVINQLLEAGVCLLEPVSGGGRIVHGLTTAQSNAPEDEEISIVEVRQQVIRVLRESLRPFVGRINTNTLIQEMGGAVDKIMRSLVAQGLLTGYADIVVARNPSEPRQVDIGLRAFPAGPLNWIYADVEFSLGG